VEGIAIRTKDGIGAAYGGKALYALALYTINGKSIDAVWTTAAAPKESSSYALKGSDFEGALSFADGTPGTVTFTPAGENVYKVVWQLASGRFEGVGVRKGNLLAAASGEPGGAFGVAAYAPQGDLIEGVWAMNGAKAAGTEVWSVGGSSGSTAAAKAPTGDGTKLTFGKEPYVLKDKKSAPGQGIVELREYLREGETFENYSKMVGLRLHAVKLDAAETANTLLNQVRQKYAGSYVEEIEMTPDKATILFVLSTDGQAELNLWGYRRIQGGVASAQFVFRNKAPYDSQKKFKAEQDKNLDEWKKEISALTENTEALVLASSKATLPPPPAAPAKSSSEEISPDLVKAIKADMDKCGKIGMEFMSHLKAGATDKAVALMHDNAFTSTSRDAFTAQLAKSNVVFGELKGFKADRKSSTFEMKDGLVNFYLHADSEYANANVHEVLRFVRNKAGDIEFVGYNRTAKE
jgi:hypothetical protein